MEYFYNCYVIHVTQRRYGSEIIANYVLYTASMLHTRYIAPHEFFIANI